MKGVASAKLWRVSIAWLLAFMLSAPQVPALANSSGLSLAAAAAASGRPKECMSKTKRGSAFGPSVWERARVPNLQRYCDLVARAHAKLASDPEEAKKDAALAERTLPGHAAPAVIEARAALSLGALDAAAKAFEKARAIDARSVEDPATMHDLARVLAKTGKLKDALGVYQALVPRVDLLGTPDARVAVLLSAAFVSMACEPAPEAEGAAPKSAESKRVPLEEAVAYLREARQRPPTQLAGDVLIALSLFLDRAGDKAQAAAALSDAHRTSARLRSGALDYLVDADDRHALLALSLEATDAAQAIKHWEDFLASPAGKGMWAGAARARLSELRKGGVTKAAGAQAPLKKQR